MRKLALFAFGFAFSIFFAQYLLPESWLLAAGAVSLALGIFCFVFKRDVRTKAVLCAVGIAAGFFWIFGYNEIFFSPAEKIDGETLEVTAEVREFPQVTDYGAYLDVRIILDGAPDLKTRVYVFSDELNTCIPGDKITFTADFSTADHIGSDETSYFVSRGYKLFASNARDAVILSSPGTSLKYLHRFAAKAINDTAAKIFPLGTEGFMMALLTGDKILINDDTALTNAMARSGVMHIITVSGMHVSILVGFLHYVFGRKRRSLFAIILVLFIFMGISGFRPSVMRAVVMQLFVLIAPEVKRESDGLTALSAALMIILALNPYAAADVGLQLSFAATLGIILFTPKIYGFFSAHFKNKRRISRGRRVFRKLVFGGISTTLGALILTMPLSALYFKYVSLVAPLVNLLILWAITPAFILGAAAVAVGLIYTPAGALIGWLPAILVKYIIFIVNIFSKPTFAAIYLNNILLIVWFACVYLCIILFIACKARPRQLIPPMSIAAVSLCVILFVNALVNDSRSGYALTALDVGQGQCLVLTSGEFTAVIDCGSSSGENAGKLAEQYIRGLGRDSVDVLFLTHYHSDHANGAEYLISCMNVGALIAPEPEFYESTLDDDIISLASDEGIDIIYVGQDMEAQLGDTKVYLYAPLGSQSENERGVCMLVSQDKFETLITGDVNSSIERLLIGHTSLPDIECLIVGHHGSKYSTCEELLETVTPEIAIISVGENTYGHPTEEVLERLTASGIEIYRTDLLGDISVVSENME
ncbi:MAG: DNA internalization-related competence protein ComEC/Rec2 [Oscillospiraceae bacterium]